LEVHIGWIDYRRWLLQCKDPTKGCPCSFWIRLQTKRNYKSPKSKFKAIQLIRLSIWKIQKIPVRSQRLNKILRNKQAQKQQQARNQQTRLSSRLAKTSKRYNLLQVIRQVGNQIENELKKFSLSLFWLH